MTYKCEKCPKEFESYRSLNGHMRLHGNSAGTYSISRKKNSDIKFNCLNCEKESYYDPNSSEGKFCSNTCCGEYRWKNESIPKILAGGDGNLKRFLLERDGHVCKLCGTKEWNCKPVPLELDHIDGNSDNDSIENVRLLCPNCHAQTETYAGRNKKNTKRNRYLQVYKSNKKQGRNGWR